ncbi:MAG: hypothetical protein AB1644_03565 [Candidatus Zixiibacteriota bacterium]
MSKTRFALLLLALFAVATFLRLYDLRADPPAYFADGSQDLTTDGAYLTLHARNAALFGTWNPFGYHHWTAFKVSLVSGLSYLLFQAHGVSRAVSDLAGVILNILALMIFIVALSRVKRPETVLFTAFFLCTSYLVSVYGRQPFTENGLLFLAALAFWVYTRWFDARWGKLLVGILVALCAFLGKLFGLLLIAGPLWYLLVTEKRERLRSTLWLFGPTLLVSLLFVVAFYREQGVLSFLWEHGAGEHGSPHGFSLPLGFFENLMSFARKDLHRLTPVISGLAFLAVISRLLSSSREQPPDRSSIFMLGWLTTTIIVLSPFNYRPLRYLFVLAVPMSLLAAEFLANLAHTKIGSVKRLAWWRFLLLLMTFWYASTHVLVLFMVRTGDAAEYYRLVWYALPAALLLSLAAYALFWRRTVTIGPWIAGVTIAAALVLSVFSDARLVQQWWSNRTYGIAEANATIHEIVGEDAVVSGQYGPAVTLNSHIRAFPFFLTPDMQDTRALLSQYPVTHLAVTATDWQMLARKSPELAKGRLIENFWLRDNLMSLVRVENLFGNPSALNYVETEFERGVDWLYKKRPDSALVSFDRFLMNHPRNKAALLEKHYLLATSNLRACQPMVDTLSTYYPTDFTICLLAAVYYKWLAAQTNAPEYQTRADHFYELAVTFNRPNESNLRRIYQQFSPRQLTAPPRF